VKSADRPGFSLTHNDDFFEQGERYMTSLHNLVMTFTLSALTGLGGAGCLAQASAADGTTDAALDDESSVLGDETTNQASQALDLGCGEPDYAPPLDQPYPPAEPPIGGPVPVPVGAPVPVAAPVPVPVPVIPPCVIPLPVLVPTPFAIPIAIPAPVVIPVPLPIPTYVATPVPFPVPFFAPYPVPVGFPVAVPAPCGGIGGFGC
jgi:hypothetical protein